MINGVSLFSNVGVGELFLKEKGVNIVLANEIDKKRASFYKHVFPETEVIIGDIRKKYKEIIKKSKEKECKFLIATPPCQGMSIAGKRDYSDERNNLIIEVFRAIKDIEPDYVLIENVPKLLELKIEYNKIYDNVENTLYREFGNLYNINEKKIINAQDYGIPQNRKRAIILMSKISKWEMPIKHDKIITVRDVIGELPSIEPIVDGNDNYFENNIEKIKKAKEIHKWHKPKNHPLRQVEAMRHTSSGSSAFDNDFYYPKKIDGTKVKGYNTTYKRMEWDKPAPTITMNNGAISSQCNVHPGNLNNDGTYSDARVLTVYEIMKLFTIPDDWDIPEWAEENFIRNVIGEGVPPLLIKKIIEVLDRGIYGK